MRIIFVSDIHGEMEALDGLPEADLLLVGGDFTQLGSPEDFQKAMERVAAKQDFIGVSGNMDPAGAETILDAAGHLPGLTTPKEACGLRICGVSGGNRSPFGTPFEWDDEVMEEKLQALPEGAVDIFISHAPPMGSGADVIGSWAHVGSQAIANLVNRVRMPLLLCGHIHEAEGIFAMGNTLVVNPGAFGTNGKYADIRWEKGGKPSVWLATVK